ncbi:MAG TPA: pitrilysin family protein [Gemmatimonadota bacterium]|nr:pitrilysin family protein [Gemmatimonadota bacterium]
MKLILAICAALAVALPAAAEGQQVAPRPEGTEFTVAGIPVIYKPIEANEVIAVRLYLRGGSANLTPETSGIENLMAAAATHGTEKYSRDEFAAREAATGTALGANANPDYTVVTMQAVREHWDVAWDLFTQAALHPTFPAEEVELVRDQIVNQLKGRLDNPDAYLALLANNQFYAGHPYATDPLGTVEAVEAMGPEDLTRWHAQRMAKENLLLVVVGNVPREDLERKIEATLGALPVSGGAANPVPDLQPSAPKVEVTERDLPTNYIRGQFVSPDPGHPDFPAMQVATDILSDRFFEEVRTKRNLSYAVFAGLSQRRANYGLLYVTAVQPDTTLAVMLHEVERLKTEPITAERLAENVNVFLTQYWLAQETNMGQAATLGAFEIVGGGWEKAVDFVRGVREVTPADIQRVAETYLKDFHFVVIGDPTTIDDALFTSL